MSYPRCRLRSTRGVEFKFRLIYIEAARKPIFQFFHAVALPIRNGGVHTEVGDPVLPSVLSKSDAFHTLNRPEIPLLTTEGGDTQHVH